eukprot:scaffold3597_cov86-Skeletonema_dohrnii-CCMP3373.AAC.1
MPPLRSYFSLDGNGAQYAVLARCTYARKVGDLRKEAIGSSQLSASKEFRHKNRPLITCSTSYCGVGDWICVGVGSSSGRIYLFGRRCGEFLAGWPIKRLHLH